MDVVLLGLGNPGARYQGTRHNVGFATVDAVSRMTGIRVRNRLFVPYAYGAGACCGARLALVKPFTFMNRSGEVLESALRRARMSLAHLVVVCDTLDLPVGECRLKPKGSSGGHRGLASLIENAGTDDFARLTIGVGRPDGKGAVVDFVLRAPEGEDVGLIEAAVERASCALLSVLRSDIPQVMNELNSRQGRLRQGG